MTGGRSITIVGGGLAGLTLAAALRSEDVPVRVAEARPYPRHRVCGEFMSGRGALELRALGLLAPLLKAGARWARTATFFDRHTSVASLELPEPALGLSRHAMDLVLAAEVERRGAVVDTGVRWEGDWEAEGCVRATGRRPLAREDGQRWMGLKAHVQGVMPVTDLEMHVTSRGYVGLCAVEEGRVNVCGLFRTADPPSGIREHWREWLSGDPGSPLALRLAGARWDDASFCAVAGLALRPERWEHGDAGCAVGDAAGMIAPVSGNGMSIAVESAARAAPWLARWAQGELAWPEVRREVSASGGAFRSRLRWAYRLQSCLLSPLGVRLATAVHAWWPGLAPAVYRRTH